MLALIILLAVTCVQGRLVQTDDLIREMMRDPEIQRVEQPELLRDLGCDHEKKDKNETERCTVDRWLAKTCTCKANLCTCKVNPSPYSIVDQNLQLKCSFDRFHSQWSCSVHVTKWNRNIYHNTFSRNESSTVDSGCIQKIDQNSQMEICVIIECQDTSLADLEGGRIRGCARLTVNYDSTKSGIKDVINVNFGCFRNPQ